MDQQVAIAHDKPAVGRYTIDIHELIHKNIDAVVF